MSSSDKLILYSQTDPNLINLSSGTQNININMDNSSITKLPDDSFNFVIKTKNVATFKNEVIQFNNPILLTSSSSSDSSFRINDSSGNTNILLENHKSYINTNLGIGIINPLEKCHINGNLLIENNVIVNNTLISSKISDPFSSKSINFTTDGIEISGKIIAKDGIIYNESYIDNDTELFTKTLSTGVLMLDNSLQTNNVNALLNINQNSSLTTNNSILNINIDDKPEICITNNTLIGIGTTNPNAYLHICKNNQPQLNNLLLCDGITSSISINSNGHLNIGNDISSDASSDSRSINNNALINLNNNNVNSIQTPYNFISCTDNNIKTFTITSEGNVNAYNFNAINNVNANTITATNIVNINNITSSNFVATNLDTKNIESLNINTSNITLSKINNNEGTIDFSSNNLNNINNITANTIHVNYFKIEGLNIHRQNNLLDIDFDISKFNGKVSIIDTINTDYSSNYGGQLKIKNVTEQIGLNVLGNNTNNNIIRLTAITNPLIQLYPEGNRPIVTMGIDTNTNPQMFYISHISEGNPTIAKQLKIYPDFTVRISETIHVSPNNCVGINLGGSVLNPNTPTANLHVKGTTLLDGSLTINASITNTPSIKIIGNNHDDIALIYHPNNLTNAIKIDSQGNIGIGTLTPNYSLDINAETQMKRLYLLNDNTDTSLTNIVTPSELLNNYTGYYSANNSNYGIQNSNITNNTDIYNVVSILLETVKNMQQQILDLQSEVYSQSHEILIMSKSSSI